MSDYLTMEGELGKKRAREDVDCHQIRNVEATLEHSLGAAQALGKVGENLWEAVQEQLGESFRKLSSYRSTAEELQEKLLAQGIECSKAEWTSLALSKDLQLCTETISSLSKGLTNSSAEAVASVASKIDEALKKTYDILSSEIECERKHKLQLSQKVTSLVSSTSEALQLSNEQLLAAKLEITKSQVVYDQLAAQHKAHLEAHQRSAEEVEIAMRITRHLAEKSKTIESTRKELVQAKEHIHFLEKKLSLPQIVEAISESLVHTDQSEAASELADSRPAGANPVSLDKEAWKSLCRQGVTLSELVHSWVTQEQQNSAFAAREKALEESFCVLQRRVTEVHHQFLEEKQRREMCERRLAEQARRRVTGNTCLAMVQELSELRSKYSEALDDKTELKIAFSVLSSESNRSQQIISELKEQVAALKRDADGDHVGRTLTELREFYTTRVQQLSKRLEESERKAALARRHSKDCVAFAERCRKALENSEECIQKLSECREQMEAREKQQGLNNNLIDSVGSKIDSLKDKLNEVIKMQSSISTPSNKSSQISSSTHAVHLQVVKDIEKAVDVFKEASVELCRNASQLHEMKEGTEEKRRVHQERLFTEMEQKKKVELLESILQQALDFVVTHLHKTDTERSSLVDRSLQDAQLVQSLSGAIKELKIERDTLSYQLQQSEELIQKNHLAILEHAVMKEIIVEDSLDSAEAAEQLQVLRSQLIATQKTLAATEEELKSVQVERENEESQYRRKEVQCAVLENELEDLKAALAFSKQAELAAVTQQKLAEQRLSEILADSTFQGDLTDEQINSVEEQQKLLENFQLQLQQVFNLVQTAVENSTTTQNAESVKETDILYKGYGSVIQALRETCFKLGLLKAAEKKFSKAVDRELIGVVGEGGMEVPSNLRYSVLEDALEGKERELQNCRVQLNQAQGRIVEVEGLVEKMKEREERLLAMCKKLAAQANAAKEANLTRPEPVPENLTVESTNEVVESHKEVPPSTEAGALNTEKKADLQDNE